ncbi:MAG: undecaprenyldiphospho-muramoylpentapeptide beta-N-acetylglucosaminyltransferase [Deltaproteobacteria bacterium]|nr:undecaprenyldiphospho-muramoylpentapeptide beta-N-acetylglucosaminyltransferase [Deltaproteobacteria bacterium]
MKKQSPRVIITGGGTGGHIFPGIAVAQEIKRRYAGARLLFAGTGRLVDRQAMRQYGFETQVMHGSALKGGSLGQKFKTLVKLPRNLFEAGKLIWAFKPDLVFGVGGYVTGPVIMAARLLGVATAIHEQNSVPGLANRILGRIAGRIFLSIPASEKYFNPAKCLCSGNPVRRDILAVGRVAAERPVLLVLGGSQGAHAVNRLLPAAAALAKDRLPVGFKVIHQSGVTDEAAVRQAYADHKINAEVAAFFSDMAAVYQRAALVVGRAGATTLAELTVLGQASILIPFPSAADDHQRKNADYLVKEGAARMLAENELTPEILAAEIVSIMTNRDLRRQMAENAAGLARPQAARVIVDECLGDCIV